jgi:transcriptional regulator with XRE-family HTH domain
MADTPPQLTFSRFLKFWRGVHGLSQEELANRLDSSPRHISRLENGSSRPSESMIMEVSKTLDLGQRDSNHLLISAGYAPSEKKIDFHAPELKWLRKAMMMSLRALDPYPAALLDSSTNILMVNRGWVAFYRQNIPAPVLDKITNQYDFLFGQEAAGTLFNNWEDTLSVILMSLKQRSLFTNDVSDLELHQRLASHPSVPEDWAQRAARLEPMASFRVQMNIEGAVQNFFSVNSTVGALGPSAFASEPNLTINTLYPEDETIDISPMIDKDLSHRLLFY